ncbi:phosphoribosylglycinamide formyltransferase [Synechococcus sp. RSCCF101]|uniref:phosphoribosylglycinamide formyltransferase n=1 Tax=Synechococcus sp. RSCCF101 TaxID=2511069 RepID=UPI001244BC76|nr:phosphoribosylglycinamide formyltransferase [Synechococcus sp. RSCCF101]QEY31707.1 phosphoribosylglycinamide formyltransferase [Synechococcus sp. RSCCF101]
MPAAADPSHHLGSVQWPLPLQDPTAGDLSGPPLRLGVMASGRGSNFEALVRACRRGELQAEVVQLVVNVPDCPARGRAERLEVPCTCLDHRRYSDRTCLDEDLIALFRRRSVQLVVMAGWMRIVTPRLVEAFAGRLINIHPSLLPAFRGMDAVGQALRAGVRLSGCTVHRVTAEVDAGEILVQAAVPVLDGDSAVSLAARIQEQEHRILPLGVQLAGERLPRDPGPGPIQG